MPEIEDWVREGVAKRMEAVRAIDERWAGMQKEKLLSIVRHNADTEFGRKHGFASISSYDDYRRNVPRSTPDDYFEAWRRIAAGERDVLFADPVFAYALSSGTTGESKRIPLNKALVRGLRRAIGYTTSGYMARTGNFSLLRGYALQMSASADVETRGDGVPVGFITGIMSSLRTYPFHNLAVPPQDVVNLADWNEKYRIIEEKYAQSDVRMIFGIPGYMIALLRRLAARGAIWPELSLIVTSGASLRQYRDTFGEYCPKAELLEMYLATEAAMAFQPEGSDPGLAPMAEDVFLEFVPEERWDEANAPRLALWEVETDVPYGVLVTTPAGLYAYAPGDTVRFTSVDPPRLVVEGRTGNVINIAAEKLDEGQATRALREAGLECDSFSVCPADGGAGHEWVLEGELPADAAQRIDARLCEINPVYRMIREGDLVLAPPILTRVKPGTFAEALRRRRGQGKILRVYPRRDVRDELVAIDQA